MSWPLKYRPRQLEDLALLDVRVELLRLVSQGNFPQTFLFAGPKGSGKTSAARIISVLLNNDLDAGEIEKIFTGNSFVINEMDAASNRGIDDIRALKEKISLPPQLGKKSVYILDEAHMLTKEAFNALLKLLEEPPSHAVFILATTQLHKIPETIISRCNLVRFRKAHHEELSEVLQKIIKAEKKEVAAGVLDQIIVRSDGSFRDAVKLLETVSRGVKKITPQQLGFWCDPKLDAQLSSLIGAVLNKNEQQVVQIIGEFRSRAVDASFVYQRLLSFLHQDLLRAIGAQKGEPQFSEKINLFLLNNLQELPSKESGLIPLLSLETKLLELIFKAKDQAQKSKAVFESTPQDLKKKSPQLQNIKNDLDEASAARDAFDRILKSRPITDLHFKNFKSDNLVDPKKTSYVSLREVWDDFLQALENQNLTLAAILKSSKLMPDFNGVTKVGVFYKFHKMQLEQHHLLSILQSCGQKVAGGMPKFEFVLLSKNEKRANFSEEKKQFEPVTKNLEQDVIEALL